MTITELIVCIVAGLGAGLGTGLAGLSAAAVVSPMLITFLHGPNGTMGGFSKGMTLLVGLKFILRPIMTTKEVQANKSEEQKIRQSILCGVLIGFICGFVGAGGGMMLLLVLTSVLGYELKTAVGTSVFIMTFTALTGAVSHFYIGGKPNFPIMIACVISTLVFAQLGAKWANSANVKMLNRVTGILLCVLGMVMLFF